MDYTHLRMYAEMYADAQEYRKSMASKLRSETIHDDAVKMSAVVERFCQVESDMSLMLRRCYRQVVGPNVRAWEKEQKGIGEHLLARLLGVTGDPYMAQPYHWQGSGKKRVLVADEPFSRTVSQLWSYCGHGDPMRKKFKGMSAEETFRLGNPNAKFLVYLIAESCMKAGVRRLDGCDDSNGYDILNRKATAEFGQAYLDARSRYEDREHATDCVRCGPSGRPAPTGSPWSGAHQHAAALRKVGKEVLKGLWIAARQDAAA